MNNLAAFFRAVAFAFAVVAWNAASPATATDCGTSDAPCTIDGGEYFVIPSDGGETKGTVIWLHGAAGSAAKAVANETFVSRFTARGYTFIAPQGDTSLLPHSDWSVNDGLAWSRDDVAFLQTVHNDAQGRLNLGDRLLLAGFSRGGSMVWDTACQAPDFANGFAAVAGSFWEPMVESCAGPVYLHHTHGLADRLVPFEGRKAVYQGFDFQQGDVMKGVNVWRRVNGCMTSAENDTSDPALWHKQWMNCESGSITLTLSAKGHAIPSGWTGRVLDWFEALPE